MRRKFKRRKRKHKNLYILAVRNNAGQITDLLPSHDYSSLMIEGMDLVKERKGSWSIYRMFRPGVEIDGGTLTITGKEVKR